jgi:hypothetical protein
LEGNEQIYLDEINHENSLGHHISTWHENSSLIFNIGMVRTTNNCMASLVKIHKFVSWLYLCIR